MARRGRRRKFKLKFNIQPTTVRSIIALVLLLVSVVSLISFFAPTYFINEKIQEVLRGVFGLPSFIFPFLVGIFGLMFIDRLKLKIKEIRIVSGLILLIVSLSGFFHVFISSDKAYEVAKAGGGGGLLGFKVSQILSNSISIYGTVFVLLILLVISIILVMDISLDRVIELSEEHGISERLGGILGIFMKKKEGDEEGSELTYVDDLSDEGLEDPVEIGEVQETSFEVIPSMAEPQSGLSTAVPNLDSPLLSSDVIDMAKLPADKIWQIPPLELLSDPPPEVKPNIADDKRIKIIKDTLKSFNIDVEIADVKVGSTFTQFSLHTKSVTKVSKIASLQENLALALASTSGSVRIEAPIPGKSLIGIEVPNTKRTIVHIKSLITSEAMRNIKSKLGISLGKDVAGKVYAYDIAKMPHMLIAGATGSGKSVFIHNLIFSILFRASPQQVKFIMVDPKRVELALYRDIPHLLTPVITDMEKAPSAFRWAVEEMERRYRLFEQARVKNIDAYNEKSGIQVMPYIVIIVDELAEVMMMDHTGVEKTVIRLAQLARATGIHLALAVQRPSTDIVTGLIKANIPCRVAFNVTNQVDSRVIIDQPGAEKLLGSGDMLFVPPDAAKPIRLQGAFVSEKEIGDLVTFLKSQGLGPNYNEAVLSVPSDTNGRGRVASSDWGDDVDALFDDAVDVVTSSGKASASLLQRKLSIGYARAARIIDTMEEKKIIGPPQGGSKARDVLLGSGADVSTVQSLGEY